ncbi:RiPP maturation radical SAM C-methyltransferase [Sphingomonas sp. R647]|uniref:RiPP maturation radical SAM C-methyltransferase n=1 Tax=Sphingomonas sp. R647 TaxID=2875233 RepID=UPI001CD60548|nr:RiPP maturation radical SAM C-methyltransferase [Sphingomonas sp. R647]MCA1196386.1 RiPP maturation radical SAM C-methyltransferase [Sphingomonas sp. R647]
MTTGENDPIDLCLFVPPFASVNFPQLGTAVLKAACQQRGIATRIVYGNLTLAAQVGLDTYEAVEATAMRAMVADHLFRDFAYPPDVAALLPMPEPLTPALQAVFDAAAPAIGPMIDATVDHILAIRPRILGLSSTFQQNMACSAIAWRVNERAPHIRIVLGGANAAWPICLGLSRAFPWIDHVFAGESDVDFPDFCERLIRDGVTPRERVIRSEPIRDMRVVAAPDFTDFFATLRPLQAAGSLPDTLPRYITAESSRGCWWGAKSHCTFCGLNGEEGMAFRHKPAERMRTELDALEQDGVPAIYMTDNIMPRSYLTELLPDLAERKSRLQLFYEVKSNMTRAEVEAMARGGIAMIQPGIESLASGPLRLMRKGVSAQQNIALLRDCAATGIRVAWGIIYGFPGEEAADYAAMAELMPLLAHLDPPNAMHRIVIDRFSPLYRGHATNGIGAVTPYPAYRALYPPAIETADIAYHFDGAYSTQLLDDADLLDRLGGSIAAWRAASTRQPRPVLQLFEREGGAVVLDTRAVALRPMTPLTPVQQALLVALDRPRSRNTIEPGLRGDAEWLVSCNFVVDYEDRLVSIVVRPAQAATAQPTRLAADCFDLFK